MKPREVRWNDGFGVYPRQAQRKMKMTETLQELPGEGVTETVVKTRTRHECSVCGEPAHYKHTFLLEDARRNPASSAYGRDDCSWCEDESRFVCAEHQKERRAPDGCSWCGTFPAIAKFAHMFLYWRETKTPNDLGNRRADSGASVLTDGLCGNGGEK